MLCNSLKIFFHSKIYFQILQKNLKLSHGITYHQRHLITPLLIRKLLNCPSPYQSPSKIDCSSHTSHSFKLGHSTGSRLLQRTNGIRTSSSIFCARSTRSMPHPYSRKPPATPATSRSNAAPFLPTTKFDLLLKAIDHICMFYFYTSTPCLLQTPTQPHS